MAPTIKQIWHLVQYLKRNGYNDGAISYFLRYHGYPTLSKLAQMVGLGKRKKKQQRGRGRPLTVEEGESYIAVNKVANNGRFYFPIPFSNRSLTEDQYRDGVRRGAITWKGSFFENLQDLAKNLERIAPAIPDVWAAVLNPYDPQAVLKAGKAIIDAGRRVAEGKGRRRLRRRV